MKRRLIAALLILVMFCTMLPVTALASSLIPQKVEAVQTVFINPLTSGDVSVHTTTPPLMSSLDVKAEYLTSAEDVIEVIRSQFKARAESFTIYYKTNTDITDELLQGFIDAAVSHTGVPDEGDYLHWNRSSCSCSADGYRLGLTNYYSLTFSVGYHTTAAQEAAVEEAANRLRADLNLDQLDDYETVKAVYDWLCDNVTYDYGSDSSTYPLRHTAYGALISKYCVCQGYALALYRILLAEGIDCRLISGDSNGDGVTDHGWNIVKLDGKYYNVDSTWDAGLDPYRYFLVSQDHFPQHDRDAAYDTAAFHDAYPMGSEDYVYVPGNLAEGTCGSDLNWTLSKEGLLTVTGSGTMTECPWLDYAGSITQVALSHEITGICAYAFSGCTGLTSIVIPEAVSAIGDCAFSGCTSLTDIRFEGDAPSFGNNVFAQVTANAGYPGDRAGWSSGVLKDYGGSLTWKLVSCTLLGKEHTPAEAVQENITESTCTSEGSYDAVIYCAVCAEEIRRTAQTLDTADHTEVTDAAVAATCASTGLTKGSHCSACGQVLIPQEIVEALGHDWGSWYIGKEATETESGKQVRVCGQCGSTETDIIPAFGESEMPVVPPTEDINPIENPFVDVYDEDYYFNPVLWAVEKRITTGMSPTTFAPGMNCTRGQIVTFLWRAQGCPAPASPVNPFVDVGENDYFHTAVLWAVEQGITNGLDSTHFGPNESCTRGQVATFLWRAQGNPSYSGRNIFSDLTADAYYYDAVLWAVENGVTNGVGEGLFAPNNVCTRGQIVTFLHRAMT